MTKTSLPSGFDERLLLGARRWDIRHFDTAAATVFLHAAGSSMTGLVDLANSGELDLRAQNVDVELVPGNTEDEIGLLISPPYEFATRAQFVRIRTSMVPIDPRAPGMYRTFNDLDITEVSEREFSKHRKGHKPIEFDSKLDAITLGLHGGDLHQTGRKIELDLDSNDTPELDQLRVLRDLNDLIYLNGFHHDAIINAQRMSGYSFKTNDSTVMSQFGLRAVLKLEGRFDQQIFEWRNQCLEQAMLCDINLRAADILGFARNIQAALEGQPEGSVLSIDETTSLCARQKESGYHLTLQWTVGEGSMRVYDADLHLERDDVTGITIHECDPTGRDKFLIGTFSAAGRDETAAWPSGFTGDFDGKVDKVGDFLDACVILEDKFQTSLEARQDVDHLSVHPTV